MDNADHLLRPGLYADVTLAVPREAPGVVLADDALMFDATGMQVAVVRPDETVELRRVSIYRDFGTSVEVREGLAGGERLVLSPPAGLASGSKVRVADRSRAKVAAKPGGPPG